MKVFFILCFLVGMSFQYDLNKDMKSKHDKFRSNHRVKSLKIDQTLVSYAEGCSKFYADQGENDHNCTEAQAYGENLAWAMTSNGPPPEQDAAKKAFNSWIAEENYYNYDTGKPHDKSLQTGHFTQVAWKGTKKIGCGTSENDEQKRTYTCCLYDPPGRHQFN
ncbi:unnamed protein product [Allacma fusca]|uniref:SCP domain-containing protein n=1 Tax=Allacma fusca TaxID=39272 RepID=A0A8J2KXY1_9HEXA|nr:unnamed protein product [Allacma fusca]